MKAGCQEGPSIEEGNRGDRLVKMELERPRGSRLGGKAKMMGWGGVQEEGSDTGESSICE